MASDTPAAAGSPPPAQVVGNAFVHQYYHVLHHSPQLVFRFYQEVSKLGRPDNQGDMASVAGMDAINKKILSVDYSEFRAVIRTVDSLESLDGGVIVLVTGYLTGKDNVKRNFTQSFFLATQRGSDDDVKGYFVLNDIFRYIDDADDQRGSDSATSGISETFSPEQEAPPKVEQPGIEVPEEEELNKEEVYDDAPEDEGVPTFEKEASPSKVIDEVAKSSQAVVSDPSSSSIPEEAPKKSYASIVKVMKENPAAPVPASLSSKPSVVNIERQPSPTPVPASATESSSVGSNAVDSNTTHDFEVDGYSIYIKNLPLNATPELLEEEFKKFGPIKPGGIQVRSHKQQGFCFGFVEFEVAGAVQAAIEASPIAVGGRQAFVEEKRPSSSRVNSRGRFLPVRGGGYRNDGMRGRGIYGGGRIYGRGDYINRSDFGHRGGGRGGSSSRSGGDAFAYQRVGLGSGGGRGNQGGPNAGNWSSRNTAQVPNQS